MAEMRLIRHYHRVEPCTMMLTYEAVNDPIGILQELIKSYDRIQGRAGYYAVLPTYINDAVSRYIRHSPAVRQDPGQPSA